MVGFGENEVMKAKPERYESINSYFTDEDD